MRSFLELPKEVIRTDDPLQSEMFRAEREAGECLSNRFVLVRISRQRWRRAIATGNARVVQARLLRCQVFFRNAILKSKLEDRLAKLDQIVFHEKLGTQGERVRRLERLAREIAPQVGADGDLAARAARLAKAI